MVRVEFLRKMRFHSYVDAGMFFTVLQFYTQKINLNWYLGYNKREKEG